MSSSVAILIALLAGTLLGVLAGLLIGAARAERSRSATSAADAERFRELSASILAESQQKLVDMNATRMRELTEATAREDIARANAVSAMVNPINERLTELGSTLTRIETSRSEDSGALKQRLESLGQITQSLQNETKILATAMKDNKARGTWGEMQLRRVVELAGLIEHCDFITQVTTEGDTGRLRPDLVVQLPQAKAIVIDSKVPLDAYLAAVNAPDEATRRAMLEKHVRDLGAHVNTLQRADYSAYVSGALDFVVMFVPGDSFLEAAFSANETWFEDSIGKGSFQPPLAPSSRFSEQSATAGVRSNLLRTRPRSQASVPNSTPGSAPLQPTSPKLAEHSPRQRSVTTTRSVHSNAPYSPPPASSSAMA